MDAKNNKIAIIICYYGKLPEYTSAFLYSCEKNSDIDWLIFSDCDTSTFNIPVNVHFIYMPMSEIKLRMEKIVGFEVSLDRGYKLCDYRVAYGLIFQDYLKTYDFWGHCDLDVIWGDLRKYITSELTSKYDKIYMMGHLSLIRNSEECNKVFMLETRDTVSYRKVFTDNKSYYFDEMDYNKKFVQSGLRVYEKIDCVDRADIYHNRVLSVGKKEMQGAYPNTFMTCLEFPKNHLFQIFTYESGKIYREYMKKWKIYREEYAYMHFRCKLTVPDYNLAQSQKYFITSDRMVPAFGKTTMLNIIKLNFPSIVKERKQYNDYLIHQHQKESMVTCIKYCLYRIRILRKIVKSIKNRRKM